MFADRLVKLAVVAGLMLAVAEPTSAADVPVLRVTKAPAHVPLALRTLSRHSAAVLAADACWRGCTAHCGGQFQYCIRAAPIDACLAHNNACELVCLRQCRLAGGPLVGGAVW
jgi:hypothetical protein